MRRRPDDLSHGRLVVLTLLLLAGFFIIIVRLFDIQIIEHSEWLARGDRNVGMNLEIERERGTLTDRTGRVLGVSLLVRSLAANPRQISSSVEVARRIAPVLGRDVSELADLLERGRRRNRAFIWIQRKIPDAAADEIDSMGIRGLFFEEEYKRFYPHRSAAAHLIGFVGIDDIGLEGIEASWDDELKGPPVEIEAERDVYGNPIPTGGSIVYPHFDGRSLELTIDLAIQTSLEEALEDAVEGYGARSASGVIVEPESGEILAMANIPTFNLNDFASSPASERRNRAVTDLFEPGSTFKPFVTAIALENGAVGLEDRFNCPGYLVLYNTTIRCHHNHGDINLSDVIRVSCNVGAMEIAREIEPEDLYSGLGGFGFGSRTGIRLPGEAAGVLRPVDEWSGLSSAMLGIGQEISVTTLQLAMATAAMANGGRLLEPRLVRSVRDADGEIVRGFEPVVRGRPIDVMTAQAMGKILEGVVSDGTGRRAAIPPWNVAGKTGTAQVADPVAGGYAEGRYNSVFVGWVPAEAPALAMAIVIHEPDPDSGYYGGVVSAPVFSRVGTEALFYLDILGPEGVGAAEMEASRERSFMSERGGAISDTMVQVPNLMGLSLRETHRYLYSYPVRFRGLGSGEAVSQDPPAGNWIPYGSEITVRFRFPEGLEGYQDFVPEGG